MTNGKFFTHSGIFHRLIAVLVCLSTLNSWALVTTQFYTGTVSDGVCSSYTVPAFEIWKEDDSGNPSPRIQSSVAASSQAVNATVTCGSSFAVLAGTTYTRVFFRFPGVGDTAKVDVFNGGSGSNALINIASMVANYTTNCSLTVPNLSSDPIHAVFSFAGTTVYDVSVAPLTSEVRTYAVPLGRQCNWRVDVVSRKLTATSTTSTNSQDSNFELTYGNSFTTNSYVFQTNATQTTTTTNNGIKLVGASITNLNIDFGSLDASGISRAGFSALLDADQKDALIQQKIAQTLATIAAQTNGSVTVSNNIAVTNTILTDITNQLNSLTNTMATGQAITNKSDATRTAEGQAQFDNGKNYSDSHMASSMSPGGSTYLGKIGSITDPADASFHLDLPHGVGMASHTMTWNSADTRFAGFTLLKNLLSAALVLGLGAYIYTDIAKEMKELFIVPQRRTAGQQIAGFNANVASAIVMAALIVAGIFTVPVLLIPSFDSMMGGAPSSLSSLWSAIVSVAGAVAPLVLKAFPGERAFWCGASFWSYVLLRDLVVMGVRAAINFAVGL
jgi:hypothetical protein